MACVKINNYQYGFHTKKLSTLYETVDRVIKWNTVTAMQIYLSNGRGYAFVLPQLDDLLRTKELVKKSNISIFAHSKLVHNPAGAKELKNPNYDMMLENTRNGLTFELDVMAAIGGQGVVIHTGCCEDKKIGIQIIVITIIDSLTRPSLLSTKIEKSWGIQHLDFVKERKVILENSAGEGSKLGGNLQDFVDILSDLKEKRPELLSQVGICIDTAHAFGAGLCDWRLKEQTTKFYEDFEKVIGLNHLSLFHLNDSRKSDQKGNDAPFGSKKDRHANLGLGYIFGDNDSALIHFFEMAYKHCIPIIGEPPSSTDDSGESGPGGKRDYEYVKQLLSSTSFPLVL